MRSVSVLFPVLLLVAAYFLYITPRAMPEFLEGTSLRASDSLLDIPGTVSRCVASASDRFLVMVPDILVAILLVFGLGILRLREVLWRSFFPEKRVSEKIEKGPTRKSVDGPLHPAGCVFPLPSLCGPARSHRFLLPHDSLSCANHPFLGIRAVLLPHQENRPKGFPCLHSAGPDRLRYQSRRRAVSGGSESGRLGSNFGVTERSGAYRKLLSVRKRGSIC